MRQIVKIRVLSMWESCLRTTYFVELKTDEGFTITPSSFQTGSIYTNFEGLSKDEARERALCEAESWGDFLEIKIDEYTEDGVKYEAKFKLKSYTTRRILNARRKANVEGQ